MVVINIFHIMIYHKSNNLLSRYTQVALGTPGVTDGIIKPISATSCCKEVLIVVTPREDYFQRRETVIITPPIQERCQFVSAKLVF